MNGRPRNAETGETPNRAAIDLRQARLRRAARTAWWLESIAIAVLAAALILLGVHAITGAAQ